MSVNSSNRCLRPEDWCRILPQRGAVEPYRVCGLCRFCRFHVPTDMVEGRRLLQKGVFLSSTQPSQNRPFLLSESQVGQTDQPSSGSYAGKANAARGRNRNPGMSPSESSDGLFLCPAAIQRGVLQNASDSLQRFLHIGKAVESTQTEISFSGGSESAARRANHIGF